MAEALAAFILNDQAVGERKRRSKHSVTSFFNKHLRGVDDHFLDNPASEYPEAIDFVRR